MLVREPRHLSEAFGYHPAYYRFETEGEEPPINYHELGLQNSRGFRALKVWLGLRQAGREGYVRMIGDDCRLAAALHAHVRPRTPSSRRRLWASASRPSATCPRDLRAAGAKAEDYLNTLNETLLDRLKLGGEVFVTNAVLDDRFLLRACIVNFRTTEADVAAIPEMVARVGRAVDAELRPREERSFRTDVIAQGARPRAAPVSNVFMTFAWYAHLQNLADRPWYVAAHRELGHRAVRVPAPGAGQPDRLHRRCRWPSSRSCRR